jgi:hypothetical protein
MTRLLRNNPAHTPLVVRPDRPPLNAPLLLPLPISKLGLPPLSLLAARASGADIG